MSVEPTSDQAETNNEQADAIAPEVLDKIKHPPAIDDVMNELSPQELLNHPAMVPQMIHEPSDLRDDVKQD